MKILRLEKSTRKGKKYVADFNNNGVNYYNIHFGSSEHEQYRDTTPLKFYSHLDHLDENRRKLYHIRHKNNNGPAGLLSKRFLW